MVCWRKVRKAVVGKDGAGKAGLLPRDWEIVAASLGFLSRAIGSHEGF